MKSYIMVCKVHTYNFCSIATILIVHAHGLLVTKFGMFYCRTKFHNQNSSCLLVLNVSIWKLVVLSKAGSDDTAQKCRYITWEVSAYFVMEIR